MQRVLPKVIEVDGLHRLYDRIEIGASGRRGVDIGTKRSIRPCWVRIEQHTPQDLIFPVRGNLVRRIGVRPEQWDEREFLSSNPAHIFFTPSYREKLEPSPAGTRGLVEKRGATNLERLELASDVELPQSFVELTSDPDLNRESAFWSISSSSTLISR